MQKTKSDRKNKFLEVLGQIQKISAEIGHSNDYPLERAMDESDLSIRKLEYLYRKLESLQKEKADRLKLVLDHLNTLDSLCAVLGVDFKQTVREIHPSLDKTQGSNVGDEAIEDLASAIERFRAVKLQRMQKLQDLATSMFEMWNLMDTPIEEQQKFQHVTCNITALEHERTEPNSLSADFINYVEAEVVKLEKLKASKMKELVLKKKTELEDLRRRTHLVEKEDINREVEAIECGAVDPALALEQIEFKISTIKEEAFSRKDILERVERWLVACEEESWLEEYNRDEKRYNAGRGTHLNLKRAEKARAAVSKIPATVETLISRITAWEKERGLEFTYDGAGLLSMLEEYTTLRQEKEQERKRQRDQKRLQGQLIAEQEVLFGSKPSPSKPQSSKKMLRNLTMGYNRRQSLGGAPLQSAKDEVQKPRPMSARKADGTASPYAGRKDQDAASFLSKEFSFNAINAHEPEAPRKPFAPLVAENHIDGEDENMTPKTTLTAPKTPTTVCAPMQMASTPAPATDIATRERSFEERRLAVLMRG
ncbi:uncharacterized protein A4U43_C04F31510 [Asparagus officinalis]|uniref:Uncharacterized protein n=2 Tax=Asparagus officinalis TaxID=4686 RepID=A0A5P1FA91_ASPOF|nr:uncharacterized protein A4U43_C04F31510 [Asparagus officinalis]